MGFDDIKKDRQFGLITRIIGAPFILLGQLGSGISSLVQKIGSIYKIF